MLELAEKEAYVLKYTLGFIRSKNPHLEQSVSLSKLKEQSVCQNCIPHSGAGEGCALNEVFVATLFWSIHSWPHILRHFRGPPTQPLGVVRGAALQ